MVESYRGSEGEGWVAPEPEDTRTLSEMGISLELAKPVNDFLLAQDHPVKLVDIARKAQDYSEDRENRLQGRVDEVRETLRLMGVEPMTVRAVCREMRAWYTPRIRELEGNRSMNYRLPGLLEEALEYQTTMNTSSTEELEAPHPDEYYRKTEKTAIDDKIAAAHKARMDKVLADFEGFLAQSPRRRVAPEDLE